ncbi:uncharacterized protein LOC125495452 [Beta vulgaris subsp. vulgaris]|uniref:uncharacterized protein LOC125495452 n=1 Tax=Beta vulgaris subsp. vulgaris TaxID=3555 RepID=UPI002036BC1B|nr:uncharacterized protein LOC125495452 [Beta vulgaris subsp. vulgaris]
MTGATPVKSPHTFHPALAVSNIKNHVSVILEMENSQYGTWAELFKIHARSHKVLHHIIPPPKGKEQPTPSTNAELELWTTIDATVLQWIYSTISNDLLNTIIEPDATAMEAWDRLRDIFQDHQNSRAVTLEQEFTTTRMEDFTSASAYCQRLKSLADQLKNVGAPVSSSRLVLQLVSGLTDAYKAVGTQIRHAKPLPSFTEARSSLVLEERELAAMASHGSASVLVATLDEVSSPSENSGSSKGKNKNTARPSGGRKGGSGRGSGGGRVGSGGQRGGGRSTGGPVRQQQPWQMGHWQWIPAPPPPCPFPTTRWARPTAAPAGPTRQGGVLGSHPAPQLYNAEAPASLVPTDIETALHTMTLTPPDPTWYMDTGATSHMTSTNGFSDGGADNAM